MEKTASTALTGQASYWNSISGFIKDSPDSIFKKLVLDSFETNSNNGNASINQNLAWDNQIKELQKRLENSGLDGDIIFEYTIPRLGCRIDVVLLIRHIVFVLEFKNGAKTYNSDYADQASNYALCLKNFHKESENLHVCPIVIATEAEPYNGLQPLECDSNNLIPLQNENINTLIGKIKEIAERYGDNAVIDGLAWINSQFCPTATIIDVAKEAFSLHNLSKIARSGAEQKDLDQCTGKIMEIISYAQQNHKKCICFVTGVPGAGKTLVGLDVISKNLKKSDLSVFVSGNAPLVKVFQNIAVKCYKEIKETGVEAELLKNLIQLSAHFKSDTLNKGPIGEHILIFDEAQRGWTQSQMENKHKGKEKELGMFSEPQYVMSVLDRHQDWAVIICLVGLGQDINTGEDGLNEWLRCGSEEFKTWEVFYSPQMFEQIDDSNLDPRWIEKGGKRFTAVPELHLGVSRRSPRSTKVSQFVAHLLNNNPQDAKDLFKQIPTGDFPIFVTRDLKTAKKWAHEHVRGDERCGLLASSGALRLRPEGIYHQMHLDVENWFLKPANDIRSSNMLELPASEFKVQGLEVDWAIVCWDANLRRNPDGNEWEHYKFNGSKWGKPMDLSDKATQIRYLINSYRVLLTRARQGMVIFVPKGVDPKEDSTRDHAFYDGIYAYLQECGIPELE